MFVYAKQSDSKEFIIGTESGMLYNLKKENPDKKFYLPTPRLLCANMKLTTLGWVANSLQKLVYEVKVPEKIIQKARKTLEKMLEITDKNTNIEK
jgi:quinolinate synthase